MKDLKRIFLGYFCTVVLDGWEDVNDISVVKVLIRREGYVKSRRRAFNEDFVY